MYFDYTHPFLYPSINYHELNLPLSIIICNVFVFTSCYYPCIIPLFSYLYMSCMFPTTDSPFTISIYSIYSKGCRPHYWYDHRCENM